MNQSRFLLKRSEISLFGLWALASMAVAMLRRFVSVQFSLGTVISGYLGDWALTEEFGPPFMPVAHMIDGAFWGAIAAVPQWLLLRRRMPEAGRWIVATIAGTALAYLVSRGAFFMWPKEQYFLNESQTTFSYRPVVGYQVITAILSAATASTVQYFVFRRYFPKAYLWPLAVVAAAILGTGALGYSQPIVFALITAYFVPLVLRRPSTVPEGVTMRSVQQDIGASGTEFFGYSKPWKISRVAAGAYPFIFLLGIAAYWILLVAPGNASFKWWVPVAIVGAIAWAAVAVVNIRKTLAYRVELSPTGIRVNDAALLWSDVAKVDMIAALGDRPAIVLHTSNGIALSVAAATDSFAYVQGFIEGHTRREPNE